MRGLAWSIILALGVGAAQLSAGTLFTNFGAGGTFGSGIQRYDCDMTCGFSSSPFTASASGQVTSVQLPIDSNNSPITIALYTSTGGAPGTLLESWTVAVPATETLVTLTSVANPTLSAGSQYWIVITVPMTAGEDFQWFQNGIGQTGGVWFGTNLTGQVHVFGANPAPAIQVLGNVTTPPPVPLPPTLLLTLFGLGLAGFAAFSLRKRNALT